MNSRIATTCGLQSLYYVQDRTEFYAVNEHGEPTALAQTSGGLWCYRCGSCGGKFDNWQTALGHVQANAIAREATA
jgi:hypothetical protein